MGRADTEGDSRRRSAQGKQAGWITVAQAQSVTYSIRDNGVDFDASKANALFAPFQWLHPAEDFPGTGVGLGSGVP